MDDIAELMARVKIQDALLRYARGVDRKDWDMVRGSFHPDAIDSHGEFLGNSEEFIDWVTRRHAKIPFSVHFLGNCLIDFLGDDAAAVETYFIAMQRRETAQNGAPATGTDVEIFGRYCDRFEKRDGAWKIAGRKVVYDGSRTQPSTDHLRDPVGIAGRRDASDTVYGLTMSDQS